MGKPMAKDQAEKSKGGQSSGGKTSGRLLQTTLRLHEDVISAIEKKAAAERRKPADVYRDIFHKGLVAEGIYV